MVLLWMHVGEFWCFSLFYELKPFLIFQKRIIININWEIKSLIWLMNQGCYTVNVHNGFEYRCGMHKLSVLINFWVFFSIKIMWKMHTVSYFILKNISDNEKIRWFICAFSNNKKMQECHNHSIYLGIGHVILTKQI